MKAESQSLAHSMNAVPSARLYFHPLVPAAGATGDPIADGAGLSLVCRLHFGRLLPKGYKQECVRNGVPGLLLSPNDCLRVAYPYAMAEAEGRKRPTEAVWAHAAATPIETLADELRDLACSASLSAAGLPAFGLLRPSRKCTRLAPLSSLVQTIAILARRRGILFVRDADPIVWAAMSDKAVDLWTPILTPGRRT